MDTARRRCSERRRVSLFGRDQFILSANRHLYRHQHHAGGQPQPNQRLHRAIFLRPRWVYGDRGLCICISLYRAQHCLFQSVRNKFLQYRFTFYRCFNCRRTRCFGCRPYCRRTFLAVEGRLPCHRYSRFRRNHSRFDSEHGRGRGATRLQRHRKLHDAFLDVFGRSHNNLCCR